jgi:hypothetical protein
MAPPLGEVRSARWSGHSFNKGKKIFTPWIDEDADVLHSRAGLHNYHGRGDSV